MGYVLLLRTCDARAELLRVSCSRWRFAVWLEAVVVTNQSLLCLRHRSSVDYLLLLLKILALGLLVELHLKSSRARVLQVSLLKSLSLALHHVWRAFFPSVGLVGKLWYRHAPKHLVCLLVHNDSLQSVLQRSRHDWLMGDDRRRTLSVGSALALKPLVEETFNAFFLLMIKLGNFVVLLHSLCLEV